MKLNLLFFTIVSLIAAQGALAQNVGSTQPMPLNIEVKGYQLGPGDEITVKVLGEQQFDFIAAVNENGMIEVPFFEKPVIGMCRTERELRTEITGLLARYLRNPQMSLRITDRKSRPPATIYGEIHTPQQIELRRMATLVEIIAASGGVKEEAGGIIQVFRTQPPLCESEDSILNWKAESNDATEVPSKTFSLAAVRLGKEEANPIILPGDVIMVHKAAPVYVVGEVFAPGGVHLKEGGMTLMDVFGKIGGIRPEAKKKAIKIHRLKEGSKEREIITVNYDLIAKDLGPDILLQPYDIVEVDKAKESIGVSIFKFAIGMGKAAAGASANSIGYRVLY